MNKGNEKSQEVRKNLQDVLTQKEKKGLGPRVVGAGEVREESMRGKTNGTRRTRRT